MPCTSSPDAARAAFRSRSLVSRSAGGAATRAPPPRRCPTCRRSSCASSRCSAGSRSPARRAGPAGVLLAQRPLARGDPAPRQLHSRRPPCRGGGAGRRGSRVVEARARHPARRDHRRGAMTGEKLIVGYDGSERSKDALVLARRLADVLGARLVLADVYVLPPL